MVITKIYKGDYVPDRPIYRNAKVHYDLIREFCFPYLRSCLRAEFWN